MFCILPSKKYHLAFYYCLISIRPRKIFFTAQISNLMRIQCGLITSLSFPYWDSFLIRDFYIGLETNPTKTYGKKECKRGTMKMCFSWSVSRDNQISYENESNQYGGWLRVWCRWGMKNKERQRWKESTQEFKEPQHCILHMYNNKEHSNNISNKVPAQNTVAQQRLLNKSVNNNNKNKCKLYKVMQEAKWIIHTLTHPCKLFFCLVSSFCN